MYCPECGTKNPEENSFCSVCNAALIDNSPQSVAQHTANTQGGFSGPTEPTGYTPAAPEHSVSKQDAPPISIDFNAAAEKLKNIDIKKSASDLGKKVKNANKKAKIIAACIIIPIVAIIAFACIGSNVYNPEKVAEKYFESYIEGDYNDMFNCLMVEKSDFITKDNFYNYMINHYGERNAKIVDYEINENSYYGSYDIYGDYSDSYDTSFNKSYAITYMLKGESHSNTFIVNLALADTKKLLFFDEYKVIADEYIVKNYTIYTVPGATVSVDGVELEKSTNTADAESNYSNYDAYIIDAIFGNAHSVTIESDYFDSYTSEIYVSSGSSDTYDDMALNTATKDLLVQKSKDVFGSLLSAAQSGSSFPSSAASFTEDYSYLDDIHDSYDDLCSEFATSSTSGYVSITPGNFSCNNAEYGNGVFTIRSEFNYNYTHRSFSWWSSDFTDSQSSGNGYLTLSFKNVDGDWIITSFSYSGI